MAAHQAKLNALALLFCQSASDFAAVKNKPVTSKVKHNLASLQRGTTEFSVTFFDDTSFSVKRSGRLALPLVRKEALMDKYMEWLADLP